MSVPAKRKPKFMSRQGRSHLALKKIQLTKCSQCKQPVLPHHVCANCGAYDGREAVKIKTKLEKSKAKKEKEKKEKE